MNIEYYTYNTQNHRPVKLAIKYVPLDIKNQDIEEDLRDQRLPFINIGRIMQVRQGTKQPTNILILTVPNTATDSYYNMTNLCHLKVKVTEYVRNDLAQCHRCQKFGHSSHLCNRAHKCVRCGGSHGGERCKAEGCKCANCGANHPASYRGCPTYLAAVERYKPATTNNKQPNKTQPGVAQKQTKQTTQKTQPTLKPQEQIQANIDAWKKYRQTDKTQTQQNQQPATSTTSTSDSDTEQDENPIKELLNFIKSFNLKEIWNSIKVTIKKIKEAESITDRVLILFEAISALF